MKFSTPHYCVDGLKASKPITEYMATSTKVDSTEQSRLMS